MKNLIRNVFFNLSMVLILVACVPSNDFEVISSNCTKKELDFISFDELALIAENEVVQIQEELFLEAWVISSDKAGNFFNEIYLQDKPENPSFGIVFKAELNQSHLFYPKGSKVIIDLQGLFVGKSNNTINLGSTFSSFGNLSVGRLPALTAKEHIALSCDQAQMIKPRIISISDMQTIENNTLIELKGVEFIDAELGLTFAEPKEETNRSLVDCEAAIVTVKTSGYSDFQASPIPNGNGSITGIVKKEGDEIHLIIRDLNDLEFEGPRCPEIITEFTSESVFISELADPDNNTGARFVELYNSASEPLDLNLWTLRRYTNDKTEISSEIDLSGLMIEAESTLIISPNAEEFELVYGFTPDLGVSTNSPADSNGDDNLELVDPFGKLIDVFGIIGEDGSGTNHEFEDGRALRNPEVTKGNPNYTFSEWTIYNDTGDAGTIKQPQLAPEDFTPNQHY